MAQPAIPQKSAIPCIAIRILYKTVRNVVATRVCAFLKVVGTVVHTTAATAEPAVYHTPVPLTSRLWGVG